ncbi:hypothetical protein HY995_01905 [Candidatus Micrarchaeota archaeon]|nr:hypothetical protein [Candidatus Micrarchaeota archaeon]
MAFVIPKFCTPVLEAYMETPAVSVITVSLPPEAAAFRPGQFFMVAFDDPAGPVGNAAFGSKAFSVSCSPTRSPTVFAAEVSQSEYKKRWLALRPGDDVTMLGPYGAFTLRENEKKIAMIAGGIGVTPFLGYLQYIADRKLDIDAVLLYSNRTPETIAFRKELDALEKGNPNIRVVNTVTRPNESSQKWDGPTGRINRGMVEEFVPDYPQRLFHACAGGGMVRDMCALLEQMGLAKNRIRKEEFTGIA